MPFEFINGWSDSRAEAGLQKLRDYNISQNCPTAPNQFSLIMEDGNGNVEAVIRCSTEWNWIFINTLFVYNQGQGHGKTILQYLEEWAKTQNHTGLYLSTATFQTPAFYEAMDYERVGQIPNFVNGYDRLFYAKRLT